MNVESNTAIGKDGCAAQQPRLGASRAPTELPAPDASPSLAGATALSVPPQARIARCENCGAVVISRFCPDCGQRSEHASYSLWHFLREATEDLTHADSRLWLTLRALLLRPGYLTREFFEGRRARYLPPVRLYLVLSVLFFLTPDVRLLGQQSHSSTVSHAHPQTQEAPRIVHPNCSWMRYDGPGGAWLMPRLTASCYKVAEDHGRGLEEQFAHNLPRALFLFLPLLALFMKPMYWRPRRYYVEHLLFFVHNHAAIFLLLTLSWLVQTISPWHGLGALAGVVVGVYVPVYFYRAMRRVYQQGHWLTGLKYSMLGLAYLVSGILMLVLVILYSYLTL
jgi:Protein of unknown function (DUF3667)